MALEPIIFEGGTWDGEYTEVHKGGRSAERTNRNGDGIDVYVRSDDTVDFVKVVKLRPAPDGTPRTKDKPMKSTVFKFAGTKSSPASRERSRS